MAHAQPGATHRSPYRLAIVDSGVSCALSLRLQPMLRCSSCAQFQGMVVGPDGFVFCAAPTARRPS